MGAALSRFVFIDLKPSYDTNIEYLEFITRTETRMSYGLEFKVPIRYYNENHEYTMIICHGNAEDIGQTTPVELSKLFGVNICLFDYAGYGLHSCKYPSEYRCQDDVIAVYKYLVNDKLVNPNKIILYGRSLGTAVSSFLALYCETNNTPVAGMILISPFLSICKIKTDIWIPGDMFTTYLLAPKIKTHTCIIHGTKDDIINISHGQRLSELFENCTASYLQDKGHNDIINDFECSNIIKQFIDTIPTRSYPPIPSEKGNIVNGEYVPIYTEENNINKIVENDITKDTKAS